MRQGPGALSATKTGARARTRTRWATTAEQTDGDSLKDNRQRPYRAFTIGLTVSITTK